MATKKIILTALGPVSYAGKSYGENMQFTADPDDPAVARLVKSKQAVYAEDEGRAHKEDAPVAPDAAKK